MQNESQNIEYKEHSSYPRNHNIANVLYKAGFVESWDVDSRRLPRNLNVPACRCQ